MWFVFWILLFALLFSGGGFYGYRSGYYGYGFGWAIIIVLWILFIIALVFAGPYWGYYGWWW